MIALFCLLRFLLWSICEPSGFLLHVSKHHDDNKSPPKIPAIENCPKRSLNIIQLYIHDSSMCKKGCSDMVIRRIERGADLLPRF